jgi:uncharacterized protein (DUF3084 family)
VTKFVIAAVILVVILTLVYFGGSTIAVWTAGIRGAERANMEAVEDLKRTREALEKAVGESAQVRQEYEKAREAIFSMSKQIADLRKKADANIALAQQKDVIIAQLRSSLDRIEAERVALPRVSSLEDAQHAIEPFHPAYR